MYLKIIPLMLAFLVNIWLISCQRSWIFANVNSVWKRGVHSRNDTSLDNNLTSKCNFFGLSWSSLHQKNTFLEKFHSSKTPFLKKIDFSFVKSTSPNNQFKHEQHCSPFTSRRVSREAWTRLVVILIHLSKIESGHTTRGQT